MIDDAADTRSHVERVMVVLEGDAPIRSARLKVDGEAWGRFEAPAPEERVLLVASPQPGELRTAGEWVAFLGRDLPPGGHVLEVVDVELADGRTVAVGDHLPFVAGDGHVTSYAGELRLAREVGP